MSNYNLGNAVGFQYKDQPVSWTRKDIIKYALGVGAKRDDLSLVYELHESWGPLPTYPVVLGLKGADQDITLFADKARGEALPGLPRLHYKKVIHAMMSIEILRDIPAASGPGWKLSKRVVGVHEKESGITLDQEATLLDPCGTPYAKLHSSSFFLGSRANGETFSKVITAPPKAKPIPKDKKPDWVIKDKTSLEQALIYRLSGDYNPLHIDPEVGKMMGFSGVILHGLSTFGFAARGLIQAVADGNVRTLKVFGARFTSPVNPGDALETSAWEIGPGPSSTTEITFITRNLTSGKVVLDGGVAFIKTTEKSEL